MACVYWAGFDISERTDIGTLTVSRGGETSAVVTLNAVTAEDDNGDQSALFLYGPGTAVSVTREDSVGGTAMPTWATVTYPEGLKDAIVTACTGQAWASVDFTLSMDDDTGRWTLAEPSAFALTWSTQAGRELCGFSASPSASATSHTSNMTPWYVVIPTVPATMDPTTNYEPSGVANRVVADDGTGYGLSRSSMPTLRDWVQPYNQKSRTIRRATDKNARGTGANVAGDHMWSFQHLVEHCRGRFPFAVSDGFGESFNEVFSFRADATHLDWRAIRASPSNDSQFNLPFRCYVEGEM